MFTGYSPATLDFLWGIRFNNEKPWFEAHKADYQAHLLHPTTALGEEVFLALQKACPEIDLRLKVSRIYRDARRLHGRGPYKDHLWFSIARHCDDTADRPVFFFELAPEYWSYGLGFWAASSDTMTRFRRRAEDAPAELERLTRRLNRQTLFSLDGPCYARPKPAPSPLLEDWYSRKSLALLCERTYDDDLIFSPSLADTVADGFRFLLPYWHYFDALHP